MRKNYLRVIVAPPSKPTKNYTSIIKVNMEGGPASDKVAGTVRRIDPHDKTEE